MKNQFEICQGGLVQSDSAAANILVYAAPGVAEKEELLKILQFDAHDLESALDPDEISRVEFNPEGIFIIWKRPNRASFEEMLKFEVSSVGVFLQPDRMTVIVNEDAPLFTAGKEFRDVTSLNNMLLRFLLHTTRHYLDHLKVIKQLTGELERKLSLSMENRYLLQMFGLSESLIYYLSALESNAVVLKRLRANANRIGFSEEEQETMDDIIIEHDQCRKQTEIYSSILSGLMDARGNVVNNNMNVLLKNLTLINVVFLPLNLIASIGGMSEFSAMMKGMDWRISYSLFMLAMAVLGWITWAFLVRKIERGNGKARAASERQPQFAGGRTSIGLCVDRGDCGPQR